MSARARSLLVSVASLASVISLGACFGGGPRLLAPEDAGVAAPLDFTDAAAVDASTAVDLGDPFAVLGLAPAHGPWTGGTRTIVRGRGFTSNVEILIAGRSVEKSSIVASDPTRIAIVTPEGAPGPADVTVKNVGTAEQRTLKGGFSYDAFVVEPASGAQTGGTRVKLHGRGTAFAADSTVLFGAEPCANVVVSSPFEIACTTPAGSIGPVEVKVQTPSATGAGTGDLSARDAYTYSDSFDPSRGGLSGGALDGALRVDVFDAATGLPLPGAKVIAGESIAAGLVGTTAANGSATFSDTTGRLATKVTVTAAAKCHQPMTFVDVPVDTVAVYLSPVIDLSCASLDDPPSTGGRGFRNGGVVSGQLVWPGGVEFKRAGWWSVPEPVRSTERKAAYVYLATSSTDSSFYLPAATAATTPNSTGAAGYAFNLVAPPGNVTIYALAGIEDRSVDPPKFSAFAMGVARGVTVTPNGTTEFADIPMDALVDHRLDVQTAPPPTTARGPDRLFSSLSVSVGANLYAALPNGGRVDLLPFPGAVGFAPLPSLDGVLAGESYVVGATAATSPQQSAPASVVQQIRVTDTSGPATLGGFLPVPTLIQPGIGVFSGTNVAFGASGAYDLATISVESSGGLTTWTIVVPNGRTTFGLPDLSTFPDSIGLHHGTIRTTVSIARLPAGFDYAKLTSGNLSSGRWVAHAWDTLGGSF